MKKLSRLAVHAVMLWGLLVLNGCGSSTPTESYNLSVGQKLYFNDGLNAHAEYGTIIALEDAHTFENGAVEPGALVDYGPRIPNTPKQWLPQRSAVKFVN